MRQPSLAIITTHPIQYHTPFFRALASKIDLEVFYCYDATPKQQAAAGFGVDFQWDIPLLDGYSYRFLTKDFTVRDAITKTRFDAVAVNGWAYREAIEAVLTCWASATPVMVRSDSHLYSPRNPIKTFVKYLPYRTFISRMHACLSVGAWSTEYFLHYGAEPGRIFQVPHVIDEERFDREQRQYRPQRNAIRKTWGIAENAVVFLFAAKFIEKKRPCDFVQSVCRAASENPRIAGLMVGDGPLRQQCESLNEAQHGSVRFAGFLNQSEIAKAYVAADALVLPSDGDETWGLVVNEAMFCGLPCVVSDKVGSGPDLVLPETGDVFQLGNVDQLTRILAALAQDTTGLASMGCRARTLIQQRYSPSNAVDGILTAMCAIGARNNLPVDPAYQNNQS